MVIRINLNNFFSSTREKEKEGLILRFLILYFKSRSVIIIRINFFSPPEKEEVQQYFLSSFVQGRSPDREL